MKFRNQSDFPDTSINRLGLAAALAFLLMASPVAFAGEPVDPPVCNDGCVAKKDVCALACKAERHACVHVAQVGYARCSAECRDTSGTRDEFKRCTYECKHDFRVAKARCKVHRPVCNGVCRRPQKDAVCVKGCAADLRECVAGVHQRGRKCADECGDLPKNLQGPCLRGCYDLTKKGARECWDGFTKCVDDCPRGTMDDATGAVPAG